MSRTLALTSKLSLVTALIGQWRVSSFGVVLLEYGGIFVLRMMIRDAFLQRIVV
jgi:drug/metabolite transporter superfamily protein YnfA